MGLFTNSAYLVLAMGIVIGAPAAQAERQTIGKTDGSEVVTIRGVGEEASKQGVPIFPGISGKTAGSKGISMLKVVIPPGAAAEPHIHEGYESAIYVIQGRVETRYGEGLKKRVENVAGDFIYIPADVPHQPVNLSQTEPAIAIVARTDANEQESVVPYPPTQRGSY